MAAAYAVHGPKTLLVVARPTSAAADAPLTVVEYALAGEAWAVQRSGVTIAAAKKVFAPANLRAARDNAAYAEVVAYWMQEQYTLRYSGGMVPDVHHILAKVSQ